MQVRGRSPHDWSAPFVARARAAATPLFSRAGPFDYMHKILPLPRHCRRRAAARKIRGSGLRVRLMCWCCPLYHYGLTRETVFLKTLGGLTVSYNILYEKLDF